MLLNKCPGAERLRGSPEITEKTCPECGKEIELFSIDTHMACECGFIAYNETQNCIKWCAYARECVGDEIYFRFINAENV
ncbi:MAG: hypothetical protein FWH32_02435 [Clostridiales bacterium]|nr:hypothetical protein [Clostridiales bacterium]